MRDRHDDHSHRHDSPRNALLAVLVLTLAYMAAEVAGGLISGSLALLADAGHMLTDAGALGLSLLATWFAGRPATPQRSFGYYRIEILAALINGAALVAIAAWICLEAVSRLRHPAHVDSAVMMGVASGGLLVNLLGIRLLQDRAHGSLNVRSALMHVIADAFGSIGTILAGAIIWFTGWYPADPLISIVVAILVLRSAWLLVMTAVDILMLGCPVHLDPAEVLATIRKDAGVSSAHDLHIWTVTSRMLALSCHIVATEGADPHVLLERLKRNLHHEYGIDHVTLQIERVNLEPQECCV